MEPNTIEEPKEVEEVTAEVEKNHSGIKIIIAFVSGICVAVMFSWLPSSRSHVEDIDSLYKVKTKSGRSFDLSDIQGDIDNLKEKGTIDDMTLQALIANLPFKKQCRIKEAQRRAKIDQGWITYRDNNDCDPSLEKNAGYKIP